MHGEQASYTVIEFMDGTRDAYFQDAMGNTWSEIGKNFLESCPEIGRPPGGR